MLEEEQRLSQVVPVLVAVLVSDAAVADPSSGKKNLIGIFDRVDVGSFPTSRAMSVYIKLVDAEGFYKIEVRYVQVESGRVLAQLKGEVNVRSRLESSDFFLSFPPMPIPVEGRYEFQIWANSIFLGGTFIDAVSRTKT